MDSDKYSRDNVKPNRGQEREQEAIVFGISKNTLQTPTKIHMTAELILKTKCSLT